ncbi:MAG TPA: hypothetical protein VEH02_00380 [Pseudolabrys sp.]|nr:hypothetical protein [Pseudolabrys sp.]
MSEDTASAVIGRPLTPGSVAGVHRRAHRRAYRHDYYGYGYNRPYGYGTYGYGYGMYRPWNGGYAYQPSNRYYQQPYYGNGYKNWTQF